MAFSMSTVVVMCVLFLVPRMFCGEEDTTVPDVLQAMDRVLNYVIENSQGVHVYPDLPFGMLLAEAQLRLLRSHLKTSTYFSNTPERDNEIILSQVTKLEKKCEYVVNATQNNMILKDMNYKKLFPRKPVSPGFHTPDMNENEDEGKQANASPESIEDLLKPEFWEFASEWRSLRDSRRRRGADDAGPDVGTPPPPPQPQPFVDEPASAEEASDACLGQVLGVGAPRCAVSPNCSGVLTEHRGRGYVLTHQLLYVQVARQADCKSLGATDEVEDLVEDLCSDILLEAEYIERLNFPLYYRDLFCEQVALCGMEGFSEFTKPEWVSYIVSWQRAEGCYGSERNLTQSLEAATYSSVRYKRSELVMAFDCLMHYTAVATAALAVGLRSLVEAEGRGSFISMAEDGVRAVQLSS